SLGLIVVNLSAIGHAERAAHLFGAVEATFEAIGNIPAPSERILARCKTVVANVCGVLGPEKFMKAKAAGHTMTIDEATEYVKRYPLSRSLPVALRNRSVDLLF